jgi:hypothetical protein
MEPYGVDLPLDIGMLWGRWRPPKHLDLPPTDPAMDERR